MESLYIERDELLAEIDSLRKQINIAEFNAVTFADKVELSIMRDQISDLQHELRELNNQLG